MRTIIVGAGLVIIVGLAAGLRFIDLDDNPGGLFRDEAQEAVSAERILDDPSYRPVFIAEGGGREALFAYAVAVGFGTLGETTLTLRTIAAAFGVAGVAAIWLAARPFGAVTSLLAAGWAAGSLWLICVSRDGMRNTIVPLFAGLAFAAVLDWQARATRTSAVLAGSAVALATLYTYQPLKLLPLLVLIWLAWLRWRNRTAFDRVRPTFAIVAVSFLVVGAPMIAYAISDPDSYLGRTMTVGWFSEAHANLLSHSLRTLGMFAITGDPNPRHNVDSLPLLGTPLSLLALVGLGRIWQHRTDPAYSFVLWSIPIFLVPPLLATEGPPPQFLRSLGLAVPVAITVGLGGAQLADWAALRFGRWGLRTVLTAAALGLLALALASGREYLTRPTEARYEAYEYGVVAMSNLATPDDLLLLGPPDARVVEFLWPEPPPIATPGTSISMPADGRVLALSRADLAASVGQATAQRAIVLAADPQGEPSVWGLTGAPATAR